MKTTPISKAMLMAAGLGTRLRPFTHFTTKALIPLMGTPVAQFSIDGLISAGVETIVANIHHDADKSRVGLKNLEYPHAQLLMSDESKVLLGSAGGLRKASSFFDEGPFFLANADVLTDVDWLGLSACHRRLRAQFGVTLTLAVLALNTQVGTYREILFDSYSDYSGLITGLGSVTVGKPFFIGAAVIEPEALSYVPNEGPAEFIPTILEPAIQKKRAGVFLTSNSWYDLGSPQLWLQTHLSLIQRLEQDDFKNPSAEKWQKRMMKDNHRLSSGVWVSNQSPLISQVPSQSVPSGWTGPVYWNGRSSDQRDIPKRLGPNSVLYGSVSGRHEFIQGIGYAGFWQGVEKIN